MIVLIMICRMPTQIVKAMLNLKIRDGMINDQFTSMVPDSSLDSSLNALSWNRDLFRILNLETISTHNHTSSKVQVEKDAVGLAINRQLLLSGATRMRELSRKVETTEDEKNSLAQAANWNEDLAATIKAATDDKSATWNADLTWMVARKAMVVPLNEDWMTIRREGLLS